MKFYCHIENGGHSISTLDPEYNTFGRYPALVYETNHYGNPSPAVIVPVLTAEQCDAMIACLEHIKIVHLNRDLPSKYTYNFDNPEQE
jgi:hypothetical protein